MSIDTAYDSKLVFKVYLELRDWSGGFSQGLVLQIVADTYLVISGAADLTPNRY